MILKNRIIGCCCMVMAFCVSSSAQTSDKTFPHWTPTTINKDAASRTRTGASLKPGLPATPYLDDAPSAYPGLETLDNIYYLIHNEIDAGLKNHLRDNPPMLAWGFTMT